MRSTYVNAALCVTAFFGLTCASNSQEQQTVTFQCNAPEGHVCQFGVRSGQSQQNFGLPSGQQHDVSGLVPWTDTYCVCDPTPVTDDCRPPVLDNWCFGSWEPVKPGVNAQTDYGGNHFATQ
jgi:hypothetical protein